MMDLLHGMGDEGRTVLFSSHILEEVEQVSGTVQVIVAGRLAASGDFRTIRRLMTHRPHVFAIRSTDDRRLAVALMGRGVGRRGRARPGRADRAGRRLRRLHPGAAEDRAARGHPGPAARCRPTSRWRASSPTWSPRDRSMNGVTMNVTIAGSPPGPCSAGAGSCCCSRCRCCWSAWPRWRTRSEPDPATGPSRSSSASGSAWCCRVIALIIGTGVLGSEIDDGTIVHILAKPLPPPRDRPDQARGRGRRHRGDERRRRCSWPALIAESARLGLGLAVACAARVARVLRRCSWR